MKDINYDDAVDACAEVELYPMTPGEAIRHLNDLKVDLLNSLEAVTNELAAYLYSDRSILESEVPEIVAAREAIARAKGESQ